MEFLLLTESPGMTDKDLFQARLNTPRRELFIRGKRHRTGFEEKTWGPFSMLK